MSKHQTLRSHNYLAVGNQLLQVAKGLDTRSVKSRLAAFEKVHRGYASAQAEVIKAAASLRRQQSVVDGCAQVQADGLSGLASALVGDGLPRMNPFRALGQPAPSTLADLGHRKSAQVSLLVVQAVRSRQGNSRASLKLALAVERAAQKLEAALDVVGLQESHVKVLRQTRDDLIESWKEAFDALKRGALAAEDEGATHLYDNLFGSPAHAVKPPATKPVAPVAPQLTPGV